MVAALLKLLHEGRAGEAATTVAAMSTNSIVEAAPAVERVLELLNNEYARRTRQGT